MVESISQTLDLNSFVRSPVMLILLLLLVGGDVGLYKSLDIIVPCYYYIRLYCKNRIYVGLEEKTPNFFSGLELLLPYFYRIMSGSSSLSFTFCFLPTNPLDNDFIRACISLTPSKLFSLYFL